MPEESPQFFTSRHPVRPVEEVTVPQAISLVSTDVVIYILETGESCGVSLSREVAFRHNLIRLPTQYKGRVCVMPGFTEEMKPALAIDYAALARRCKRLKDLLAEKTVRVSSELGTDVQFNLQGRTWILNDGDLSRLGLYGNLPAGRFIRRRLRSPFVEGSWSTDRWEVWDRPIGPLPLTWRRGG